MNLHIRILIDEYSLMDCKTTHKPYRGNISQKYTCWPRWCLISGSSGFILNVIPGWDVYWLYSQSLISYTEYLTYVVLCMSGSRCTSLVCKWCCTTCWWIQLIWDPPIQFSVRPSSRFTNGFLLMAPWFASCWILRPEKKEFPNSENTFYFISDITN